MIAAVAPKMNPVALERVIVTEMNIALAIYPVETIIVIKTEVLPLLQIAVT